MADNKYRNGKIYKVVDNAYTSCYYGSTVEQLSKRMAKHRRDYNLYKEGKKAFYTIYKLCDEFQLENCKIELVELYPCNSKEELAKQEGTYIKDNDCVNKKVEGRSKQQWRKDHPEVAKEIQQRYYESHRDEIAVMGKSVQGEEQRTPARERQSSQTSNKGTSP